MSSISESCSLPRQVDHAKRPSIVQSSLQHHAASDNSVSLTLSKIDDYCGLVLNDIKLFLAILSEEKVYEIRTVRFISFPARVVFHPNRVVRQKGYTQNIEALIQPHHHHMHYHTEAQILQATANGRQLGLTEEFTRQYIKNCKRKKQNAKFYLYKLSEPRLSQIEWFDHKTYNQLVFSRHQYCNKRTGALVQLFRFPIS